MTNVSHSQLRIRNGAVKRLQIPKDKLEKISTILNSKRYAPYRKDKAVKAITGECCACRGIPMYEVLYDVHQAIIREKYCNSCVMKLYARESVL